MDIKDMRLSFLWCDYCFCQQFIISFIFSYSSFAINLEWAHVLSGKMLSCAFVQLTFLCFTSVSWMHHLWSCMLFVPEGNYCTEDNRVNTEREFKIHFWDNSTILQFCDQSAFLLESRKKNCKLLAKRNGVLIILHILLSIVQYFVPFVYVEVTCMCYTELETEVWCIV